MTPRRGRSATTVVGVRAAAIATLVGVAVLGAPFAAQADTLDWSQAAVATTYGDSWAVTATLTTEFPCGATGCPDAVTIAYTGPVSGSFTTTMWDRTVYLDSSLEGTTAPLPVGEYSFVATYTPPTSLSPVTTSAALPVTVAPTVMTTDLRVASDPGNPAHAVISVAFQGDYLSYLDLNGAALPIPAGTWAVEVADADGKALFSQSVDQAAGGPPFLNLPWADVPPTQTFDASASFTVSGSDAANFTLGPASASFTSPTASPTPTPTAAPGEIVAAPSGVSIPIWLLILFGVIFVGCAIAITVLLLADRRRRRAAEPPAAESTVPGPTAAEGVDDDGH